MRPRVDVDVGMSCFSSAASRMSLTSVLFPEPDTPVTQVNVPSGNAALTCFRLCSLAPSTASVSPFPRRRDDGTGMRTAPDK